MSRGSAGHNGMSRSGIVIATVILLIGCYLSATSVPSKEDTIGFEPWPSSSPVASYDDNNLETIIIGIDLGTSSSRVSVYMNDRVEFIPNDQGNYITPPWVAFTDSSERPLVGEAAKDQAGLNPERTIFNVKRLIGRKFVDEEVQRAMKEVPYKIVNKDEKPYIQVEFKDGETKVFSPEEISAMIVSKLKDTAETFVGKKVTEAVVTVPAYFNDAQRQATKDAFSIAGWSAVTAYREPLAIAYAYGLHKEASEKNVLFYHLGDGTFDVSIVEIDYGVLDYLAINADTHLGGEDFTQRIVKHFIKLIKDKYGKDISKDDGALVKLRMEAERAKKALSSQDLVHAEIDSLVDGVNISEPLTRARFEELNKDLFLKTMGHVKKAMEDAELEKRQIHEIVLVGGSTKIPKVQQILRDYFDGRVEPKMSLNPDEVLAIGSAVLGDSLVQNGEKSKIC